MMTITEHFVQWNSSVPSLSSMIPPHGPFSAVVIIVATFGLSFWPTWPQDITDAIKSRSYGFHGESAESASGGDGRRRRSSSVEAGMQDEGAEEGDRSFTVIARLQGLLDICIKDSQCDAAVPCVCGQLVSKPLHDVPCRREDSVCPLKCDPCVVSNESNESAVSSIFQVFCLWLERVFIAATSGLLGRFIGARACDAVEQGKFGASAAPAGHAMEGAGRRPLREGQRLLRHQPRLRAFSGDPTLTGAMASDAGPAAL